MNGGSSLEALLLFAVTGWRDGGTCFMPKSCAQIINYVSAHDNFTLWDKLVYSMHEKPEFEKKYEDVLSANKLAAFIYFTCQGNLFMQAGEEFGRTKWGEGNSYNSLPEINMLKWSQSVEYKELVEYYKGLIRLRKKLPGLCDKSASASTRITEKKIYKSGVVSFRVDNRSASEEGVEELLVIYNADSEDYPFRLPEGRWAVLVDAEAADLRRVLHTEEKEVVVAAHSGMMLALIE